MIKPILCTDVTNDKNNEAVNGDEFISATVSDTLKESLERSTDDVLKMLDTSKLPLPLRIIEYLCGITAIFIIVGIARADVSISEGYKNAPALFWIFPVCAVIWLVLFIASKIKQKRVLGTDESGLATDNLNSVAELVSDELGVPKGSPEIDLISFSYKVKNDEIVIKGPALEAPSCDNLLFNIFKTEGILNFANLEHRYSVPLGTLRRITKIKKRIKFEGWNKDIEPKEGKYKQYKLTVDQFGNVYMKEYYILELENEAGTWGICFPCYELPIIESITGLKAE